MPRAPQRLLIPTWEQLPKQLPPGVMSVLLDVRMYKLLSCLGKLRLTPMAHVYNTLYNTFED